MKQVLMIFLALLTTAALAHGDEPAVARPKIALVLSGGGARGFAHVGVLQWLEEHRIPVDMIAGTSMGGLVGGLYSTGMTPAELRKMVASIDWADLFRPVPAYDTLSFRRKEDRRAYPNSLELGLRGGFKFPPGVNPGHVIGLLLDRYTLPYSELHNFDDLPISFRCIATDMVKAKQVVMSEGSLPEALQATMAIPGVFYPVEIDGLILASDGGLLNNVPTDVAEQMGADVIIAVNIGTPLANREALDSLGGILSQTISVAMEQNIRNNLDPQLHPKLKAVITPALGSYTTFSFDAFEAITNLGYAEAEKMSPQLMAYALDVKAWEVYLRDRQSRIRTMDQLPVPQSIRVIGPNNESQKSIAKALERNVGKQIDPNRLDQDLTTLWGRGRYAGLSYRLKTEGDRTELLVHAREKSYAPPFLNVGLEINNTQTDVFDFNLRARVTLMDLVRQGTEWRFDGSIGSEIALGVEHYKLLGSSRFFLAPRAFFNRTKTGVFRDEAQLGEYQLETADLGADIGYALNSRSELRLGYDFGHEKGKVRIGDPGLPEGSGKFSTASLRWAYDSTDSSIIPTRGIRILSSVKYNFDVPLNPAFAFDEQFSQETLRATGFMTFNERNTIFLIGEGDTTFHKHAPPMSKFPLGGLMRVSAAARNEFLGDHLLYGSAGYLRKLADLPYLVGEKLSAALWYEAGTAYDNWNEAEVHQSLSTGVIAETFLGPIFVGFSVGDHGRHNFFVAVGRVF